MADTKPDTAALRDRLTGALIGLARATEGNDFMLTPSTAAATVEGLAATAPHANSTEEALLALIERADAEKRKLVPSCYVCAAPCGRTDNYDLGRLQNADETIRSLKSRILRGARDIAAHCALHEYRDESIHKFLYLALFSVGMEDWGTEELLPIVQEMEEIHSKTAALPG